VLRGPTGKIKVQSNKYRLWHSGSDIWKKNNTGGDVVLPNGFYKCVVTTLGNHTGTGSTTTGSFWSFRGIFDYVKTSELTNDDQPYYTVDITQSYHRNDFSTAVDNSGRAEIVYRPNDGNFEGGEGENDDAINKMETYIRWKDFPADTTTDFVRLRFRMFPILIGE
jgi:hypothetical protein